MRGLNRLRPGSDMLLTLVDADFDPLAASELSLTAELLCTNRHLAEQLPAGAPLMFELPGPVGQARLLRPPRPQTEAALDGASRWKLVSQLSLNHLSLSEGPQALAALREMLALHNLGEQPAARRQIEGITALGSERIVDHVGADAWRGWRNGLLLTLELDPACFAGGAACCSPPCSPTSSPSTPTPTASCAPDSSTSNRRSRHGAAARPQPGSVAERLLTRPQGFEFAQAVMLLERLTPQAAPLGQGADPAREALRLRGPLLPAFAASELSALEPGALGGDARDGQPALDVESFGLGGPDGPLPYAYQEWLQQRRQDKDHAPAEFLQLFQHRLLALLYRAQRKYRLAPSFAPRLSPARPLLSACAACCPPACNNARRCRTPRCWPAPPCWRTAAARWPASPPWPAATWPRRCKPALRRRLARDPAGQPHQHRPQGPQRRAGPGRAGRPPRLGRTRWHPPDRGPAGPGRLPRLPARRRTPPRAGRAGGVLLRPGSGHPAQPAVARAGRRAQAASPRRAAAELGQLAGRPRRSAAAGHLAATAAPGRRGPGMSAELSELVARLNPSCRKALELAAQRCLQQSHYYVEIEHVLLELLELPNGDLPLLLPKLGLSTDQLSAELRRSLDQFKRGETRAPAFSSHTVAWLRKRCCWPRCASRPASAPACCCSPCWSATSCVICC